MKIKTAIKLKNGQAKEGAGIHAVRLDDYAITLTSGDRNDPMLGILYSTTYKITPNVLSTIIDQLIALLDHDRQKERVELSENEQRESTRREQWEYGKQLERQQNGK